MIFTRTYSQLKDFFSKLASGAPTSHPLSSFVRTFIFSGQDAPKVHFGLRFFGLDVDAGLREFRSNRFFLDSLNVDLMPTQNELIETKRAIENAADEKGIKGNLEDFLDDFINVEFEIFTRQRTPKCLMNHPMPVISTRDLDFLDQNGYLVVENAIPTDLCEYLSDRLETIAKLEERSVRGGGYFYGSGRMQRVYCLLGKDPNFQQLLLHPICHQVMSHMFQRNTFHDKYYLTSFHGNILKPGAEPQIWHIDANVPEPIPPWIIRANSNYVLQDLTHRNGATEIIPGSHKLARKPTKRETDCHDLASKKVCAPKGSLIFWHGHLWHRSGENLSSSDRQALLAAYAASFFREVCMEENPYLYASPNNQNLFSSELKTLLGWEHGAKNYS